MTMKSPTSKGGGDTVTEYGIVEADVESAFEAAMWQQIVSLKTTAAEIKRAREQYMIRWRQMRRMQADAAVKHK